MQTNSDSIKMHNEKIKGSWRAHSPKIVLFFLLIIFFSYSIFIAVNLQPGIIPDEPAHFAFSKHFSNTWGIPADTYETYTQGWYIQQNPFLYFWINGRIINFIDLFKPNISEWETLVLLRLVNVLYAVGTVIVCYLLSKELIKHRWWQLLPVFLLTNTLMFVFLAGGVNYDNLANLLSIAAIFYLVRLLNHRDFILNSFAWITLISTGTLVKYPILPLGLVMTIVWIIYIIRNKKIIFPLVFQPKRDILLSAFLLLGIIGNMAIYGYNLLFFQAITPPCKEILTETQCALSPYIRRYNESALDQKLTIIEAINSGYPDPITYIIDSWIPNMFYRIFGILGHISYFPALIIVFYRLLFYWIILLAIRFWKRLKFLDICLIGIFAFYSLVLLITNFNSELVYGFRQIAVQGRYIFTVIGIVYVLIAKIISLVPNNLYKFMTVSFIISLFLYGGPIKFVRYYDTIFSVWFNK